MRILSVPDPAPAPPAIPMVVPAAEAINIPTPDEERVTGLERVIDALQERIQALEERLQKLETAPRPAAIPVRPPAADVTWDAEDLKKNLLTKMWKYLQDDHGPQKAV